ncbi:OmpA family protein [Chryseolinea lacunae]|uniref:Carboxypeptidase regulatory-like domain-containing protein n=1 Tax=Chryseolinea lacunae TaxID=2801331 RepID=A0ABS1KLE2_9BACT|nr:carboxypeptidase regulatory-like domain-containing protein [Chryseolinea lacunae]MBL0740052.1 carboxypeptidase regulatory-like domain-containing protein [Chryseolinea lacunae]
MKRILFSLFFFMLSVSVFAQNQSSRAYYKLADSLFRYHNYFQAVRYYERALKNSDRTGDIQLHMARSYFKMNNAQEAEGWFEKAAAQKAAFSPEDAYDYVQALLMKGKREAAEQQLKALLQKYPDAQYASKLLNDLGHVHQYYQDSIASEVKPLIINSPASDFGPAFYKDGLVFSSAQEQSSSRQKYHWDNSSYLKLFYSPKSDDQVFQKPVLFDKSLDTRFHDGPATFFGGYDKMILTRNEPVVASGAKDMWLWNLSLYEATRNPVDGKWLLTKLPFNEPSSSMAHPAISEDGNILYFTSDKPGGYGGTDLYRVVRTNGVWGKPYNLGPGINTPGNEAFPFLVNNQLYFASNGHGGLGGLDIFKSVVTVNGFARAVNAGYPLNSTADDFSLIMTPDGKSGYFSSSRSGNDDLYTLKKRPLPIQLLAHIYDGESRTVLAGAKVQLISSDGDDRTLTSDEAGMIPFELPDESTFILIGTKDGKTGMTSAFSITAEDRAHTTHQIPVYGDTNRIACVGIIKDATGVSQTASKIIVRDKTTGKMYPQSTDKPVVSFLGERGHAYTVEIENDNGDTTTHDLTVATNETGAKTWTMTLKESLTTIQLAAHVFKQDSNQSMPRAAVKIITFSDPDLELTTDDQGRIDFSLPNGTAFMAIADAEGLSGMYSGMAEPDADKKFIVHPIPMRGDAQNTMPVMVLVTDNKGEVIDNTKVVVTENASGERMPVDVKDGLVTFLGEKGKTYGVSVNHKNFQDSETTIVLSDTTRSIEKVAIDLERKPVTMFAMAARVFKADDQTVLAGAQVKVISFEEPDLDLTANAEGVVEFTLPEEASYVVIADKDGYTGMHSGFAEEGTDKSKVVHPIPAHRDPAKSVPVVAQVVNDYGEVVSAARVVITERGSGKKIDGQVKDGVVTFFGEKGKLYSVAITHEDHQSQPLEVAVPEKTTDVQKVILTINKNKVQAPPAVLLAARIFKAADQTPLGAANVKIISFVEADQDLTANAEGLVDFSLPEGTSYVLIADKNGYTGMHSGTVEKGMEKTSVVHPVPANNDPAKAVPIAGRITDEHGKAIPNATVKATDKANGNVTTAQVHDGVFAFVGEKGHTYKVALEASDFTAETREVVIEANATALTTLKVQLMSTHPNANTTSTLVILNESSATPKFYITSGSGHGEIVEENGALYYQNGIERKNLGSGTLAQLKDNPQPYLRAKGLDTDHTMAIQTLYFDFNNATLDELDKAELDKVKTLLLRDPSLVLAIDAHADDRGGANYNVNLSKKRGKNVVSYLEKQNVNARQLEVNAYGESRPVVPCETGDCTEAQHQQNRRAELLFGHTARSSEDTAPVARGKQKREQRRYADLLDRYGDKQATDLVFKLSIGAYRFNNALTFDELKDLGAVEMKQENGITYYYLAGFPTLNAAEAIRKQVIERGVKDATVSIFYKNERIAFPAFMTLAD